MYECVHCTAGAFWSNHSQYGLTVEINTYIPNLLYLCVCVPVCMCASACTWYTRACGLCKACVHTNAHPACMQTTTHCAQGTGVMKPEQGKDSLKSNFSLEVPSSFCTRTGKERQHQRDRIMEWSQGLRMWFTKYGSCWQLALTHSYTRTHVCRIYEPLTKKLP